MIKYSEFSNLPVLDQVLVPADDSNGLVDLHEGRKWVSGRFERNIGIDRPTSGMGQTHAHVYGRDGKEIVAVNIDGTASHGTKGKISDADAAELKARGFTLPPGNIVEWTVLENQPTLVLG